MIEVAIDYGRMRSGFAIYLSGIVLPLDPLVSSTWTGIAERLKSIRNEHGTLKVILGNPLSASGKPTELSDEVGKLAGYLVNSGFSVELVRETGSSAETESDSGIYRQRDGRKDSLAAMIILKRYLGLP
jgi:putative holliday junction resolvase